MGCGGSTPETEPPVEHVQQAAEYEQPQVDADDIKFDLARAEAKAVESGPEKHTFLASVLRARLGNHDDAAVMEDCCSRLQAHNRKLKSLIATSDAEAVREAFHEGGFLGRGTNHQKLIAVLCSRTKSQLEMSKKRYRAMYDGDMRKDVAGETSGYYGKMISFAMASKSEYIADMIDVATKGWGCDETVLVELFVMCEQEWLQQGKALWEGRNDRSLIDHLNQNLSGSYAALLKLLLLLLKGDLNNEDLEVDEEKIQAQVSAVRDEVSKSGGMFGSFSDESVEVLIDIIGANNTAQNCRLAELYENTYSESLTKAITDKAAAKVGWCLSSLLLPRPDFVAARIEKAMKGWGTDQMTLVRLLGGLDGRKMLGVLAAYERKYSVPLATQLSNEVDGKFLKAALEWIRMLDDPAGGMEEVTEAEVSGFSGDAPKLSSMCDFLLLEYEMLMRFAASLDMETLCEAIQGRTTDDTMLIRTLATRSKRFLGRISYLYREEYGKNLSILVDENCDGWYAYLAKFLVLQPSQSDALLLDLALEGSEEEVDKNALIEFLCARHPRRVRAAKKTWERRTDESLVDKLSDSLSGDMRTIALTMLKGKRMNVDDVDEEQADLKQAKAQAKALQSDMSQAIEILCANSPAQNAAIARTFEENYDMSLGRALGEEFNGTVKAALSALLLEPAQWYAQRLKASFKGLGTSDRTVCRIIGAHDKDEIKAIAAAYDDRYGQRLKVAITKHCTGDYRRLAVAWVDLPDQLEQPAKLVEVPGREGGEGDAEAAEALVAADDEEDDEEDDEDPDNLPDPSSIMYKAKILQWTKKLETAEAAGKARRTAYYRRLLCMYPPLPSGHSILRQYHEALTLEYKNGDADFSDTWMEAMDDDMFVQGGTTKDIFAEWQKTSEILVKDKLISLGELKAAWGLSKKSETLPEAPEDPATAPEAEEAAPPAAPQPTGGMMMGSPPSAQQQMGMMPQQPAMPRFPSQSNMMQHFGQAGHVHAMFSSIQMQQTVVQQTIVQQPASYAPAVQKFAAVVPFGMYGGMQMMVDTPHGRMRVTIPPGYGPGSSFTFNVPRRF